MLHFYLYFISHSIKLRDLPLSTITALAALPATDVCLQQSLVVKPELPDIFRRLWPKS